MGVANYFKAGKASSSIPTPSQLASVSEKFSPQSQPTTVHSPLACGRFRDPSRTSSRVSLDTWSMRSTRYSFLEDIKHEVMVNYLYQQQCSHLWVSDGSGECEGVLLRKAHGHYLACPPQLANSMFAMASAELNVQVSVPLELMAHADRC